MAFADALGSLSMEITCDPRALSSWEKCHLLRQLAEARGQEGAVSSQLWSGHSGLSSSCESHGLHIPGVPGCPPCLPGLGVQRQSRGLLLPGSTSFQSPTCPGRECRQSLSGPRPVGHQDLATHPPRSVCQARGSPGKCPRAPEFALRLQRSEY